MLVSAVSSVSCWNRAAKKSSIGVFAIKLQHKAGIPHQLNKTLPLMIQTSLQLLFECGSISWKTPTRGAFCESRHGSQRLICQITNACSITLTCQKMVVNIAVGRQGWLGNSLKLPGQTGLLALTESGCFSSTMPTANKPFLTSLKSVFPLSNNIKRLYLL